MKELEKFVRGGGTDKPGSKIISTIQEKKLTAEDVKRLFLEERHLLNPNIFVNESDGSFSIFDPVRNAGSGYEKVLVSPETIKSNLHGISRTVIAYSTLTLDGQLRLSMLNPSPAGDLLQNRPSDVLGALFKNRAARQRLRGLTHEAFGLYFTIDPTAMSQVRVRMSHQEPHEQEYSLTEESVEFFRRAQDISEFSDGVRAYTGILSAVLCSEYLLIFIDEPEAFLHPPLVKKLGRRLAEFASERGGNVFTSSHSADFLMGSIQAGKMVNVIRLTYKQGAASARLLPPSKLEEMMRNPFLRSSGVLSALFHDGAVVCEADTDRTFYQEVNERLLAFGMNGIDNCLFLNSNGKDTLRRIVQPLREMGIPAAAVVDLDVIRGGTLKPLLQAAFVPSPVIDTLNGLKDKIFGMFQNAGLDEKKVGINALDKSDKESAEVLIRGLADYGIFVVPVGEVEMWLPQLQAPSHGPYWLSQIFERMGADPDDKSYLKPGEDDVWAFLRKIAVWVSITDRKGMPG